MANTNFCAFKTLVKEIQDSQKSGFNVASQLLFAYLLGQRRLELVIVLGNKIEGTKCSLGMTIREDQF